jgi:hypothetical protein
VDRPDAVGHFRRQRCVSSPAQGRHAGTEGRGAAWSRAGRATDRSIRGHRARYFVGGASEAAYLGRQRAVRRRGRRVFVNIDDFAETLPGEPAAETAPASEVAAQLQSLPARQRDVLQSIAVDSASIKDTAAKFAMSEGAVRVALHRGLASLTAKLRDQ